MGTQLNSKAQKELIEQDIEAVQNKMEDCLEKRHVIDILKNMLWKIDFDEKMNEHKKCPDCNGTGEFRDAYGRWNCAKCNGTGQIR